MSQLNNGRLIAILAIVFAFSISHIAEAATTPTLTTSATYGILSSTYTDTSGATTVNGDVGFTTPPASAIGGLHPNYGSGGAYSSAGTDQAAILGVLNSQSCDFTFSSATDLSLLVQPLTPGVYCITGAQSVGAAGITLTSGTYIFRSTGALNTVTNSIVSGGDACDVFWTPVATTLGANSTFVGTDIDDAAISVGAVSTWLGRALSFGGTVTTDTDTITVPTCVPPPPPVVVPPVVQQQSSSTPPPAPVATVLGAFVQATSTPVVVPLVVAIAPTVVQPTVTFPNTGFAPQEVSMKTVSTFMLALASVVAFALAFVGLSKKV